jgi:genome maintenance exonuclease 1
MITEQYDYGSLKRKSVDGRRMYSTPDGLAVPSVTTILDKTKPEQAKKALREWKKRVGETKAAEITKEAAGRGTRMHAWLEQYVKEDRIDEPGSNPYSQQSHKMANIIVEQGLDKMEECWGTEVPLYFPQVYAGTTDCLGVYNGKPAIIDFKQTNKPKKTEWIGDYFMQLCAYAAAHNEVHGTDIQQGVILMCSKDYQYQTWTIEGEDFEEYSRQWWTRVGEYYGA